MRQPFHLANRLQSIAPFHAMEVAKQAAALAAQGRSIMQLALGEPDFTAPEPVIRAAQAILRNGQTQYTSALGLPALREAISGYYASTYGLDIDAERIIITAGASAALVLACAALVEVGSEVLMPDPSYPCNRHFVATFGGTATMIPCGAAERYQLTEQGVAANWKPKTRGVMLASPSNPTGTSIAPAALAAIVQNVRVRGGFTLVDELYQGLSYDAPPVSALSLGDDIITVNSFSKFFNMTGWRLGWLVVPPSLVPEIEKLAQNLFICASSVAQHAALACFHDDSMAIYRARRDEFKNRRDFIVPAVRQLGFQVPIVPDGAFYIYANCTQVNHPAAQDADQLVQALLHETGVVMVPGKDFGNDAANHHVRMSYATALPNLEEAVTRLAKRFAQG